MAKLLTAKSKESSLSLEDYAAYSNIGGIESRSPIKQGDKLQPNKLRSRAANASVEKWRNKLMPLINARKILNKVYSNGYFENHYKEADADLKKVLHEQTMAAHSRLKAKEEPPVDSEEPCDTRALTININT
jgi:hypothetical protein